MKRHWILPLSIALVLALVFACGEKMKMPTEVPPTGNLGDTLYLMLNPPWDAAHGYNLSHPTCIFFGHDTYLYIADTGNNRVLQLDAAGTIHDEFAINNPISINQDELMRLLVVTGERKVYKINVGPGGDRVPRVAFDLDNMPNYSDTTRVKHHAMIDSTDQFISIADLPTYDKTYFVAVSSPVRNNGRILWFRGFNDNREYSDTLFDRIVGINSAINQQISWASIGDTLTNPVITTGNGVTTTTRPNSIYTYQLGGATHLIVCQDSGSYPVHDFTFQRQVWDQHWVFNYTHSPSGTDLLERGFFSQPKAATVDLQGNIFVAESDSLASCGGYEFSKAGQQIFTLCGSDSTNANFRSPQGIAYDIYGDRRTVFVADTGHNRILRFKLSTDLEQ